MKLIKEDINVSGAKCKLENGQFNGGQHIYFEADACSYQTLSVKLPNGKFVTFAFVPGSGGEIECVDIHTTAGVPFKYKPTDDDTHYQQQVVGFCRGADSFDTRDLLKAGRRTGLITVLLHSNHNKAV